MLINFLLTQVVTCCVEIRFRTRESLSLVLFEKSDTLIIHIPTANIDIIVLGKRLPHFRVVNQYCKAILISNSLEKLLGLDSICAIVLFASWIRL